jgi:hypothetical protein
MVILRTLRLPTLALAALLICACNGDEARVKVGFHQQDNLPISMLRVRLVDGFHSYELGPADFNSNEGHAYHSPKLPTRTSGTLHFAFALVEPSGDTVSGGAVELPLRRDWSYEIDIQADSTDPTRTCFGCQGSRPFHLAPEYREPAFDSVYVIWGGNYISEPVMY